jgi:DNA-binding MarR family transcriptional regulator
MRNSRLDDALMALRLIQRQTELASKRLAFTVGLTPSQLLVLQLLSERGETSSGEIAQLTQLKHATITSLVDKLVSRDLVQRRRCETDRRRVWLCLLPDGETILTSAPDTFQQVFETQFTILPDWQQSMLIASLEHVVDILTTPVWETPPDFDEAVLGEVI